MVNSLAVEAWRPSYLPCQLGFLCNEVFGCRAFARFTREHMNPSAEHSFALLGSDVGPRCWKTVLRPVSLPPPFSAVLAGGGRPGHGGGQLQPAHSDPRAPLFDQGEKSAKSGSFRLTLCGFEKKDKTTPGEMGKGQSEVEERRSALLILCIVSTSSRAFGDSR